MQALDYKTIFLASNVAITVIERDGTVSMLNDKILKMFHVEEKDVIGRHFMEFFDPRDRDMLVQNHIKRMEGATDLPQSYKVRMHINDVHLWVSLHVAHIKEHSKSIISFTDITDLQIAEERLEEQLNAQNAIFSAIPDLMFELSQDGKYLRVWAHNPKELAKQPELLLGKKVQDILPQEAAKAVMHSIKTALKTGVSQGEQIHIPTPSGKLWFELSAAKKESRNTPSTVIMLSRNITDRKELELKLLHLSRHDVLTNLYNRRALEEKLQDDIQRTKRYHLELSVCMLDIDYFKKINDTYGHAIGDNVLEKLATILQENLRDVDYVGRYGGEEFVIVLPDTKLQNAYEFSERLREKIASLKLYDMNNKMFSISVSIGVAGFCDTCNTVDALLQESDEKMYLAKESGRNCVKI